MPIIRIDFDKVAVSSDNITDLSRAVQKVVSEATGIEDVFVYANSSEITLNIAPIEVFIEMSANAIEDQDALVNQIKQGLTGWKQESGFVTPVNLTLIPMSWKIEIGI